IEVAAIALSRAPGGAKANTEVCRGRTGWSGNERTNRTVGGEIRIVNDEVRKTVRAGVVELATAKAEVVDDVLGVIHIATELQSVIAGRVGHRIRELRAAFVREGDAFEEFRNSESEAVVDESLRRPATHRIGRLPGQRRLAEL